jgi:hypothetical protein
MITPVEQPAPKNARLQMNSYISLILEAEGAKERLRRLFQSAPEGEKPGCAQLYFSEELALIVERSSKEVVRVDRDLEFDASVRARLAFKQTELIWMVEEEAAIAKVLRQRPTCVAAFMTTLGYFLGHLYP